ncbi:FKBP-type peptidyl-prolyl cis-trans isomerase [Hymenobacter sp. BT175]|nr:FKBP-type peptidyl-prolyl cis-trans isomerase [Hymenobacter translucens]
MTMKLLGRPLLIRLLSLLLAAAPVALLGSCNTENVLAKAAREHEEEFKKIDDGLIMAYLTRHNITNYQRLNSGMYLVPITEGTGTAVTSGKTVEVKYIGKFLTANRDGEIFDNSTDNRTPCGCISFVVGAGRVIKGWDQGLLSFKKGDRKLLLIPSYLAYGPTGSRRPDGSYGILPDTPLLFDMEILNVQ